jgi:hypothetical protein
VAIRRYTIHPPQLVGRLSPALQGEPPEKMVERLRGDYDAAMQELQRFLRYLMDANDTGQAGSGIVGVVAGAVEHGEIAGLLDDDHTQYLKEKGAGGLAAEIPLHAHAGPASAGTIDHGALTSLADDDHLQYLTAARHAAVDAADHGSGAAPDGYVLAADGAGGAAWEARGVSYRFAVQAPPAGSTLYRFQRAARAGTITKVHAVLTGAGSADVNVELGGVEILGADLAVTPAWSDSGAIAEAVAVGDEIDVSLQNVVAPVSYLVVQIDFSE